MNRIFLIANFILSPLFLTAQIQLPDDTVMCPDTLKVVANVSASASVGSLITGGDDIITSPINIGFPFVFYGNSYNQCRLCTNNYLTFNMTEGAWWDASTTLPNDTAAPLNAILFPWEDLNSLGAGTLMYAVVGSAPDRKFIFQICNSPFYGCAAQYFSGQVVLYETSNIIETYIFHKGLCAGSNEGSGIHGLHNATGTIANIVAGRNYPTNWTTNNEGMRFTPNGSNDYLIATIPFTPYSPSFVTWTVNGMNTGTGDSITFFAGDTAIIIASATSCSGNLNDTMLVFVPSVNLQVSATQYSICYGNEIDLSATGAEDYLWIPGNISSSVFTDAPVVSTTYTIYGSNTSACLIMDSATIEVDVNPLPNLSVLALTDSVCVGDPTLFSATGADTYLWYPGFQTTPLMFFYPLTSVTLNCTGVDTTTGCSVIISSPVTVFQNPELVVSSDTIICTGDSVLLMAQGAAFYSWSSSQLSGNVVGASIVVSPDSSAVYSVTGMSIDGCHISSSVTVSVTVCNAVSINEKISSLQLFPNPTDGRFFVSGISKNNWSKIFITNLVGQKIIDWKILSSSDDGIGIQLDPQISNGVYLLNYETENRNEIIKLIVIR